MPARTFRVRGLRLVAFAWSAKYLHILNQLTECVFVCVSVRVCVGANNNFARTFALACSRCEASRTSFPAFYLLYHVKHSRAWPQAQPDGAANPIKRSLETTQVRIAKALHNNYNDLSSK